MAFAHEYPIAYELKEVIAQCEVTGLHTVVTASDGPLRQYDGPLRQWKTVKAILPLWVKTQSYIFYSNMLFSNRQAHIRNMYDKIHAI
jgi:hypothetical protein